MTRNGIALLAGAALAVLAGIALLQKGEAGKAEEGVAPAIPSPESGRSSLPEAPPLPVVPLPRTDSEAPDSNPPGPPPVVTKIAPGTPEKFLQPYLLGHTPVEILEDGTQIYEGLPFYVRQPDGSQKIHSMTVRIAPTDPVPVLPVEPQPAIPPR